MEAIKFFYKMRNLNLYSRVIMLGLVALFWSCETDLQEVSNTSTEQVPEAVETFTVNYDQGVLVFSDHAAMDATINELQRLPFSAYEKWEEKQGFSTIYGEFNRVVLAEEKISDHYFGLPEEEQELHRSQPEIHSSLYDSALNDGVITLLNEEEGGYFDYAVSDPYMAPVLNLKGLVVLGGALYQYTDRAVKIILDGDFSKLDEIGRINKTHQSDNFVVIINKPERNGEEKTLDYDWTTYNLNNDSGRWYTSGRKGKYRWRMWIDGHSESSGNPVDDNCTRFLSCTFTIRTQAQKKNFWGNYQYNSSFSPSFNFDNSWTFSYGRYNDNLCGLNSNSFSSVPTYSCSGNPSFNCPTSPHSNTYPTTNNGFFNQTPHGQWSATGPLWPNGLGYFSTAMNVRNGSIESTYNGEDIDFTY